MNKCLPNFLKPSSLPNVCTAKPGYLEVSGPMPCMQTSFCDRWISRVSAERVCKHAFAYIGGQTVWAWRSRGVPSRLETAGWARGRGGSCVTSEERQSTSYPKHIRFLIQHYIAHTTAEQDTVEIDRPIATCKPSAAAAKHAVNMVLQCLHKCHATAGVGWSAELLVKQAASNMP